MGNVHIIVINGLATSGKSTFCQDCIEYADQHYCDSFVVKELSTVDSIKFLARLTGWCDDKSPAGRQLLNKLKMATAEYNNWPIASVYENIDRLVKYYPEKDWLVFVNSREIEDHIKIENEAERRGYNFMKLLISRPGIPNVEVPSLVNDILTEKYDMEITNDGSKDELMDKAITFLQYIRRSSYDKQTQ